MFDDSIAKAIGPIPFPTFFTLSELADLLKVDKCRAASDDRRARDRGSLGWRRIPHSHQRPDRMAATATLSRRTKP